MVIDTLTPTIGFSFFKLFPKKFLYIPAKNSIIKENIKKGLKEAIKYKSSPEYYNLISKASEESKMLGIGEFSNKTFESSVVKPKIKLDNLQRGTLAEYSFKDNTITLDPSQEQNAILSGFHEGLHYQRVGSPRLSDYKGSYYNKWLQTNSDKDWSNYYNSKEIQDTRQILNAQNYIEKKVNEALYDNAGDYLRIPGELQTNGLEAGLAIGLKPFQKYPGLQKGKEIVEKARDYNPYLYDIKSSSPEDNKRFWNILTGQYTPSILILTYANNQRK